MNEPLYLSNASVVDFYHVAYACTIYNLLDGEKLKLVLSSGPGFVFSYMGLHKPLFGRIHVIFGEIKLKFLLNLKVGMSGWERSKGPAHCHLLYR
jgi:hypothetical protein